MRGTVSASSASPFGEVEKIAETGSKTKASWTGILSLNLPALNLGSVEYHLRLSKMKGSQEKPRIKHVDTVSGREVEAKEVAASRATTATTRGMKIDRASLPLTIASSFGSKATPGSGNPFEATASGKQRGWVDVRKGYYGPLGTQPFEGHEVLLRFRHRDRK